MANDPAYYSISSEDPEVYHDNNDCPAGKQIKKENRRSGTNNRPLCKRCNE